LVPYISGTTYPNPSIYLRETDLSNGEGLETIGVRISEIPN